MAALHKCGIVHTGTSLFCVIRRSSISHTDIKPDNIMVSLGPSWSDETVSAWVQDHPPRVYNSFQSLYKVVTEALSPKNSLLLPWKNFRRAISSYPTLVTVRFPPDLNKFSLSRRPIVQEIDDQTTDHITPLTLRAPEVILGGPWDEKVDIWTFGCLACGHPRLIPHILNPCSLDIHYAYKNSSLPRSRPSHPSLFPPIWC